MFQVWTDGVKRYDSGVMTGATASANVNVEYGRCDGAARSSSPTEAMGTAADHGDWADAQVTLSAPIRRRRR